VAAGELKEESCDPANVIFDNGVRWRSGIERLLRPAKDTTSICSKSRGMLKPLKAFIVIAYVLKICEQ